MRQLFKLRESISPNSPPRVIPPSSPAQLSAFLVHLREPTSQTHLRKQSPSSPKLTNLVPVWIIEGYTITLPHLHHDQKKSIREKNKAHGLNLSLSPCTRKQSISLCNNPQPTKDTSSFTKMYHRAISNQPNNTWFQIMLQATKYIGKEVGDHFMGAVIDLMEALQVTGNPRSSTTICYLWRLSNRVGDTSRPQF